MDRLWEHAVASLQQVAAEPSVWEDALAAITALCGAEVGQFCALDGSGAVLANWVVNSSPDAIEDYVRRGGPDPAVNPRGRHGTRVPLLQGFGDDEALAGRPRDAFPIYRDFDRWGVSHSWQVNVDRHHDLEAALVMLNPRSAGPIGQPGRDRLPALGALAAQALRLQMALEHRTTSTLGSALEDVAVAAFLCSVDGRVLYQTAAAERLLREGRRLRLRRGRLEAARPEDDRRLAALIEYAARDRAAVSRSVAVAHRDGGSPVLMDVARLRRSAYSLGLEPAVLVLARVADRRSRSGAEALGDAFGLTGSEVSVAAALGDGSAPEEIAHDRGVSVATIRTQIRSIYGKLGVSRQAQLIRLLHGGPPPRGAPDDA